MPLTRLCIEYGVQPWTACLKDSRRERTYLFQAPLVPTRRACVNLRTLFWPLRAPARRRLAVHRGEQIEAPRRLRLRCDRATSYWALACFPLFAGGLEYRARDSTWQPENL